MKTACVLTLLGIVLMMTAAHAADLPVLCTASACPYIAMPSPIVGKCYSYEHDKWVECAPRPYIITVKIQEPRACPLPPPGPPVKNADGTYTRPAVNSVQAIACWHTDEWREEWTAPPENGGTFIRRLP